MTDSVKKIDIGAILKQRAARYWKFIPRWAVRWLERTIHQDEINHLLECIGDKKNVEAADIILNELGISVEVKGMENLVQGQRYVFASNHPLGGLDGIALIQLIGSHYNGNIRFMVNDLLMHVYPFKEIFMPVNKFGRQSREGAQMIDEQFGGDNQMITFPAGLCSRMQPDGTIADLEWHKHVVSRAIHDHRDVVPVKFDAVNSRSFYRLAKWRKRLGIKFNFEQLYLPDELFKKRGETLHVIVGEPVPYTMLDAANPKQEAARLRDIVYDLK